MTTREQRERDVEKEVRLTNSHDRGKCPFCSSTTYARRVLPFFRMWRCENCDYRFLGRKKQRPWRERRAEKRRGWKHRQAVAERKKRTEAEGERDSALTELQSVWKALVDEEDQP